MIHLTPCPLSRARYANAPLTGEGVAPREIQCYNNVIPPGLQKMITETLKPKTDN